MVRRMCIGAARLSVANNSPLYESLISTSGEGAIHAVPCSLKEHLKNVADSAKGKEEAWKP